MATAVLYARGTSAGITFPGLPSIDALGYLGGIRFSLYPLVLGLFSVFMTLDLIRKLVRDREEKLRLVADLEAARTVQRMLLPATGLSGVECVYEPAQEVGGDFYFAQRVADRSTLVVSGDVSGKGLKAAMVVSLITGMLDRRHADSPATLLAELNRALCSRLEGGFVTCCAVRMEPDGRLTAANGGHPSPYLDGRELELSPGLPLGVVPEAEYTEVTLLFDGQLTLVSDGVIEASNASGELFGFDRTREISTKSAQEIAEVARAWGQTDDITVVTVRRTNS
jgi:serine phosphatase RsbU (regulator of sigma subunit)